jgi:hypothetical protein
MTAGWRYGNERKGWAAGGDLPLGEWYAFDLGLDPALGDTDFEPDNPPCAFARF